VASSKGRGTSPFSLIAPPTPIPDVDDEAGAAPAVPPPTPDPPAVDPEPPAVTVEHAQPAQTASAQAKRRERGTPSTPRRASPTIRLWQPSADALYEAFLQERRTSNPRLTYPEFASRIVDAGLRVERGRRS